MITNTVTSPDEVQIFHKDWGNGAPIVFSHGWPSQGAEGHDMDHYADDLAPLVEHLDLHGVIHIGQSTGGGEVVRYFARHGEARAAKAVLIAAVPPRMVRTEANTGGLPEEVFDGLQHQLAAKRAQFCMDMPSGPFYGFNRPRLAAQQGGIRNWWRQAMMGGIKAHSGPPSVRLLKNALLKTYAGYPHGMPVTHADAIGQDILDFIRA